MKRSVWGMGELAFVIYRFRSATCTSGVHRPNLTSLGNGLLAPVPASAPGGRQANPINQEEDKR